MKRLIMAAVLLVSTVSVFATESSGSPGSVEIKNNQVGVENITCTVSLEGEISVPGVSIKVTCSASAPTCKEAISTAKNCLEEAKKAVFE